MKIDQIKSAVVNTLEKIIMGNLEGFRDTESFKVRPGYGYDKFYLDWVEGSYDMSLQGLIHYIMYEDGFYKEILTDSQYAAMEKVIEDSPGAIYGPEMGEDDGLLSTLDDIYEASITYVAKKLTELGFDVEDSFSEYLPYIDEDEDEKFASDYVYAAELLCKKGNHDQAKEQIKHGLDIANSAGDYLDLAEVVYRSDSEFGEYGLDDKNWGKQIFNQAIATGETFEDLWFVVSSVERATLDKGNDEYLKLLLKRLEGLAQTADDFFKVANCDYFHLEGNKIQRHQILQKSVAANPRIDMLLLVADNISYIPDIELSKSLYKKAIAQTIASKNNLIDFKHSFIEPESKTYILTCIANGINNCFKDTPWAESVLKQALELADGVADYIECSKVYSYNLDNNEAAKAVFESATHKAENAYEYIELAESIKDILNDKKWVKLLIGKAEQMIQDGNCGKYDADICLDTIKNIKRSR